MLNGKFRGRDIGSGTDVWRFSEEVRAGKMSEHDFMQAESCMSRSTGTCNVMGTASTMGIMADALGLGLPHNAEIPAVDSRRYALAHVAGRRIVDLVKNDVRMSQILTRSAFENAIRLNGAVGGSTNAVIHLLAIAGRVGVPLSLEDWDDLGRDVPTLVDLMPSGRFLMEDFYYAGGLPAVMRLLAENGLLNLEAMTVNGQTIGENCKDAPTWNTEVIRPFDRPLAASGGIAVLRGNLAPCGAVLKPSAASPELMKHRGRAVVFENIEDYKARIADPDLEVDATSVLVLKNCGPKGYPGMAEVGNMGLPPKLLRAGRHRHGADLRCAHERDGLRHRDPACESRGGRRRPARARAERRHHRARRAGATVAADGVRRRARAPARSMAAAGADGPARRLRESVYRAREPGRSRRGSRFSRRLPGPCRTTRVALSRANRDQREGERRSSYATWLEVDGHRYQNGSTRTMVFGVPHLVSYLSRYMSLQAGDLILTGTPPGVGLGQKPPVYLRARHG